MTKLIAAVAIAVAVLNGSTAQKCIRKGAIPASTPTATEDILAAMGSSTIQETIASSLSPNTTANSLDVSDDNDDNVASDSDEGVSLDSINDGSLDSGNVEISKSMSTDGSNSLAVSLGSSSGAFTIGSVTSATSTIESTYTNWVGSAIGTTSTAACYREAHLAKTCPLGFESSVDSCWAQCPYPYPVECGLECIRQNDDCALEVLTKVSVVAQSALSFATLGLYGDFKLMAKGLQVAIKCSKDMLGLVKSLAKYVRNVKVKDPQTSQDKLLTLLYQTDNVVIDLPVTVASCLGIKVDDSVKFADRVLTTAELALKEIMSHDDEIVASWESFTAFMKNITLGDSLDSLNESDISSLKSAMESNSTCGYDMKRLLDRTWMTVADLRRQTPDISEDDIRVAMSESNLVLNEIPTVTNNCMGELVAESDEDTAYSTRDTLRKTFGGIVDDLISSGTSSNGTYLTAEEYAFTIADKALSFYAVWDVFGFVGTLSEYFQAICGPTQFIGEIDDGSAAKALALSTVQDAFNSSSGTWTKVGNGTVTITFQSVDTQDVTVNIKSGGTKIDEVAVAAGETVTWTSNVTTLGGNTLYLDRWRPGFLGLPGTGEVRCCFGSPEQPKAVIWSSLRC